ncbi:MAG: hypothetical protein Fur002_03830 [Anaerolineales bacterium]
MNATPNAPQPRHLHELVNFGERLRNEESLLAQRERIAAMTGALFGGAVDVWLNENAFRLPDWSASDLFPLQPVKGGMRLAIQSGKLVTQKTRGKTKTKSRMAFAAIPLEDQQVNLGALQVTRPKGPSFSAEELNLLEGLAQIVSMSLVASQRAAVEQFRLRQLNLVRAVSAQIANELNLDELARRVTELIQKTFNYYYVAIFTLEADSRALRFRSSAVAPRKGRKKAAIALQVELGQGLIGYAAQSGEGVICDDVHADSRYRFIDALPETQSEVAIPLKIEERVVGVLDVQSNAFNAFHPNDLLLLSALANTIAQSVENATLYHSLRRRADQLALISEVSKSVAATLNLSEIMQNAAALIHDKFGYPHVSMFSVHLNRRVILYQAGSGKRSKKLDGYSIPLDDQDGIIAWAARNGQTVIANDVSKHPRYVPSPLPPKNTQSELCVPLIFDEEVVGILDIQSDQLNAFTQEDKIMFEAVADTMAAAIRNADLYRSEQWRRQVADSMREVAGLVSSNVGVDEALETILTELDRNLPIDISAIWLLQDDELRLAAVHGCDPQTLQNASLANPESTYGMTEAFLSDEPVIRKPSEPLWVLGLAGGFSQNYSSIAAPLKVGERALGVLALSHRTPGRYGHEAQAIAATFASYASVAIENARLYDAAQEQAYASAALLQVAQSVVSLNALDEILASIIRIMPILVGVHRVALYRWDDERQTFFASHEYGFAEDEQTLLTEREFSTGEFPLLDEARATNQTLVQPLAPDANPPAWLSLLPDPEREGEALSSERILIGVPLCIKNDFFGVLLVEEAPDGRRFRARRIEIINGIAQQAALAIQNDLLQQEMVARERLETEVSLARQIQQTFIPQTLPEHESWQMAARWRTARQVGGDFYDVIQLPDDKFGIFIADVSDKGMPAALFMALTRTLVRAAVFEQASPAEALRRVNDQLLPDTQQGMFVTAVYGVLDAASGTFTYVNAGHNPPLWVKAHGEVEKLTRTGIALGATEQPRIEQRVITLNVGDTLLLYTDGLTEAFSPEGELFGDDRLAAALQSIQTKTADEVLSHVEECLNEFIESNLLGDDLTMLAIRRR